MSEWIDDRQTNRRRRKMGGWWMGGWWMGGWWMGGWWMDGGWIIDDG
jgi:hypothetical protein